MAVLLLAAFVVLLPATQAHAIESPDGQRIIRMGIVTFGGVVAAPSGHKANGSGHTFSGMSANTGGYVLVSGLNGPITPALGGGGCDSIYHSADVDFSNSITLTELLRGIQFFNVGAHSCDPDQLSEDGYLAGSGVQDCCPHNSDYNPFDWNINLLELLRLIQFFNVGSYHYCPLDANNPDGYCPGPE